MYKVKLDGKYLYHPWDNNFPFESGKLTQELNKNGMFDFSIPFTHPLISSIQRRKSIVEVVRFNKRGMEKVIYRGCCMNDTGNTGLEFEVETDGDLVFLQDSVIRPFDHISANKSTTPGEHFRWLVAEHNGQVDAFKRFTVGLVNVSGTSEKRKETSYATTREAVETLVKRYGGYIRTRTEGDVHYIDYLSSYGTISSQDIRQGKNIIDITKYVKTDEMATRIIPIGTNSNDALPLTIKSVNNSVDYIQDDAAVSEFGVITKVVEFPDIESPSHLLAEGKKYLETAKGANLTVELTAVDLADAGYDIDIIGVGDMVSCAAPAYRINTQLQVSKKVTDILNPANSRITLGVSIQTLTQKQLHDNTGVLPMVRQAVSTAGNAAGNAAQAVSDVQNVQQQVDTLRSEMPAPYTHPSYTSRSSGLYKIAVDGEGHVSGAVEVSKADITKLGISGCQGICATASDTAAKTCSITGFSLLKGTMVIIRFYYKNTASNPTLNVSETGAKPIYYQLHPVPPEYIREDAVLAMLYDGSCWWIVGDLTDCIVDRIVNPAALYNGSIYAFALQTWAYTSIPGLSAWKEVRMWVEIGDAQCGWQTFTRDTPNNIVSGYVTPNYYGCMQVLCDFANNRIGVYVKSKVDGWGFSNLRVLRVEGLVKL